MDENNMQDFFNLGSNDNSNKVNANESPVNVNSTNNSNTSTTSNNNPNPNVAPLDDFFNNVEPLSTAKPEAQAPAQNPQPLSENKVPESANIPEIPIMDTSANTTSPSNEVAFDTNEAFQSTMQNTMQNVNQGIQSVNNQVQEMHNTIDTNPMQTTISEKAPNSQYFNSPAAEPDPMLEHMADNNIPGADLNNSFAASNPAGVSSPNPSDVYKNSAAMNYANNAQGQVNFNQTANQNINNGYSTKKKNNPFLVFLLILLIIAVVGVLGYFAYITIFDKRPADPSGDNQNTVTPVVDDLPDTYQYLTDLESLSSTTLDKLKKNDEFALIDSDHGVLKQTRLPVSMHFDLDNQYYVLDLNKNGDMFFEDIKLPKLQSEVTEELVFYFVNSNLEFVKGSLIITDLTGYDFIATDEGYEEPVTMDLWEVFYNDKDLVAFYKLGERYYLKLTVADANLMSISEDELTDLLENLVADFAVSTDSTPADLNPYTYVNGFVSIDSNEYSKLELDDSFTLNLVDSLYITNWTINKTDNANIITALTKDDSYNIQIVELEEPIKDINKLASELSADYKASQTLFATYTDDNGSTLQVPVIADSNNNLLGIAIEADDTCYLFLIAGSSISTGSYATTYVSQEDFLNQMTYLFKNVIKYTPGENSEEEENDEDETENKATNKTTNSSTNTTTNEVEDDEDNNIVSSNVTNNTTNEVSDEDTNTTSNNTSRNTTRNTTSNTTKNTTTSNSRTRN